MKIAVDAMGGDYAPREIVAGTLLAAAACPEIDIILVGQVEKIKPYMTAQPANVALLNASEAVEMDEHPASAVRRKKDASIVVATRLVREGKADAVVSAGNTGAQMAAALLGLGRIQGIDRPAIIAVLPTLKGGKVVLDVGANPDAKAENLLQYALMGSIYAEKILGLERPQVGLLNIGSEEGKGNELTQLAYPLLKQAPIHFAGNVEGRDIPYGRVDVVVCEGFVGNVLLKSFEGLVGALFELIKEKITANSLRKLGALAIKPGLKEIAKIMDYTEVGGAPLLGVNGISVICHGSSNAKAISNAVRVARECVEVRLIEQIREDLRALGKPDSGEREDSSCPE
ncbi:MAG: phosphate acyltransferase PlsX [Peptococcaceae bacterium]|nr:phosphate acyltransferase PlsX [Peptococcaceae bacterium]